MVPLLSDEKQMKFRSTKILVDEDNHPLELGGVFGFVFKKLLKL